MEISTLYQIFNQCNGVTTDSRHCPKGSLFIALKGDTFNGNAFAAKALEADVPTPSSTKPNISCLATTVTC